MFNNHNVDAPRNLNFIEVNKMYGDRMDTTRVLKPQLVSGDRVHCRIFWRERGALRAGGLVILSKGLFLGSMSDKVGFYRLDRL